MGTCISFIYIILMMIGELVFVYIQKFVLDIENNVPFGG